MALDKVLKIYDENGNPVDYDILASDVKFLPDGKDLPTKLTEMEDAIKDAAEGGGYTPPQGGIPKSDLAQSVQETLDDVVNKVDKETGKSLMTDAERTKLQNLPTADQLTQQLSTKANDADVVKSVSVNGTAQSKDTNGNVNIQVQGYPMDSAPTTGNTDHVVSSAGIKTALDAKANAADVPTKTEMSDAIDDALGEAQVTVVPAGSVGIISSLGSDSDEDALSASMGKKLKVAIITILNSLGNYAFPDGKPVIDWGDDTPVTYTVSKTIGTGLSATGGDADVALGDSLEVTIAISNNLYVVDDDSVVVTMGGQPVAGAWNASTMKVTIAAVTGNVAINVPSMTYVSSGLVLMFDGMNKGETAGQWKDIANTSRSVALTGGYTKNSDNVQFDGTGYGSGNFVDDVTYDNSTAECVIKQTTAVVSGGSGQVILLPGKTGAALLALFYQTSDSKVAWSTIAKNAADSSYYPVRTSFAFNGSVNTKYSISYYGNKMMQNGSPVSARSGEGKFDAFNTANHLNKTFIGAQITGANAVLGFKGSIYCVRLYSRTLTDAEVLQNWKVDQKRFNIS